MQPPPLAPLAPVTVNSVGLHNAPLVAVEVLATCLAKPDVRPEVLEGALQDLAELVDAWPESPHAPAVLVQLSKKSALRPGVLAKVMPLLLGATKIGSPKGKGSAAAAVTARSAALILCDIAGKVCI